MAKRMYEIFRSPRNEQRTSNTIIKELLKLLTFFFDYVEFCLMLFSYYPIVNLTRINFISKYEI